jgi:hypothetical protein
VDDSGAPYLGNGNCTCTHHFHLPPVTSGDFTL